MESMIMNIRQLREKYGKNLVIPLLQRGYVWRRKEHRRLFTDILQTADDAEKNSRAQHFLGEITLKGTGDGRYEVIDGQQRLTTLTVLLDMLGDAECFGSRSRGEKESYFDISGIKVSVRTDIAADDVDDEKDIYCSVYNYFAELMTEYGADAGLIKGVIEERVFVNVYITEGSGSEAFEALNATGEPLVYTDLILNDLISMRNKEGADSNAMGKLRRDWESLLGRISNEELPPENEGCSDGDDEENAAETVEAGSDGENGEPEMMEGAPLKMLKIKKFFNALHSTTLPERESFPEGVDDFKRMMKRLYNSFYSAKDVRFDTGFIIRALNEWADCYIEYIAPLKERSYSEHLFCLRTIGNVPLIPAVMRTLFRVKRGGLDKQDAACIFHALASAQLLRAVYTDRDNNREMDKKLRIADYIYISCLKELDEKEAATRYSGLLELLADTGEFRRRTEQDGRSIESGDWDSVALWNMQYSSGFSKAILAIRHDMSSVSGKKIYEYEQETEGNGKRVRFEAEHMAALKLGENGRTYADYGYNNQNVNSFWNLELLESGLNKEAGNLIPEKKCGIWGRSRLKGYFPSADELGPGMKSSRAEGLRRLYDSFKGYCFAEAQSAGLNSGELKAVSYHREGLNFSRISEYREPESGKVYSVAIKNGSYVMEPEILKKDNRITRYHIGGSDTDDKKECLERLLEALGAKSVSETEKKLGKGKKANYILKGYELDDKSFGLIEDISDNESTSNVLFVSEALLRKEEKKNNGSNSNYSRLKDKPLMLNGEPFYFNINTDADTFINAARRLYSGAGKAFRSYVEKTEPEMHYVSGRRILTRLVNIGDRQGYEDAVLARTNERVQTAPAEDRRQTKEPAEPVTPYISAGAMSFGELGGYRFIIPEYQRRYVWGETQFGALESTLGKGRTLGTVILYEQKKGVFSVVDGQQRLTTLGSICRSKGAEALSETGGKKLYDESAVKYFKDRELSADMAKEVRFNVLIISGDAPETFQYKVFGTINGCGRRLTVEDKVKNFLCSIEKGADMTVNNRISNILQPGFIKAYTEMNCGRHISENELYESFKAVYRNFREEYQRDPRKKAVKSLDDDSVLYGLIKGNNDQWGKLKNVTPELKLWVGMYRLLKVNTSDGLLLYWFRKNRDNAGSLTGSMRRLIMMYFLLYVDDPNGNSKKSINSKLPALIGENAEKELVNRMWGELILDSRYKEESDGEKRKENIFDMLCAFELADKTPKHTARFILLLCELWLGTDPSAVLGELTSGKPSEIEHIFPANPKDSFEGFVRPNYISKLENVCLLEADLNKKVSNHMLIQTVTDKNTGKAIQTGKLAYYGDSCFKMPKMLCESSGCFTDPEGRFGKEQAENRIRHLRGELMERKGVLSFSGMLREVSPENG